MIHTTASFPYSELPVASITNDEYMFWHRYWVLIRDCTMGEMMVKHRRSLYLPRLSSQTDDEYQAYLSRAVFYNTVARTINGLVGAVHTRPPIIEGLPDALDLTRVTRDGQSFQAFMKRVTREVVSVSRYGVLVDAPSDGGDPYFAGYLAEDIVDWSVRRVNGRDVLERVILREFFREGRTNLTSEMKEGYRICFLDEDGIYRQRFHLEADINSDNYEEFVPMKLGRPMTYIPFTFINPYDFGTDIEKPAMLDIAMLNISHYQSYAALEAGRFYTATPVWAVFLQNGGSEDMEYKVGPNIVWQMGSNDKVELKEFAGPGLKYLENALTMKEHQIATLGGKLASAARGTAAESSESVAMRERGEASFLQSVIATMSDAATLLLKEMATWLVISPNEINDIRVRFSTEAVSMYMSARELRAMESLYKSGLVPVEVMYAIFRDANILPPTTSLDEYRAMLPDVAPQSAAKIMEAEGKEAAKASAQVKLRGTQPRGMDEDDEQ